MPDVLRRCAIAILVGCACGPLRADDAGSPAATPSATSTPSAERVGTISGTVTYTADPQQPWRYQRYYVKGRDAGPLGEALVVLRGSGLRNWPAPAQPQTATVDQFNFQFVPELLAIRAGDTVKFTNSDTTVHNVRSTATIAPFNVNLEADDEYTHTFKRAGDLRTPVTLGCVYHGGMRAWIYVFDHPFFQVTDEAGAFRFEDVPAGRYTLEMIHPAGQLRWTRPVTVKAGEQTIDIDVSAAQKTLRQGS
jgi:plastocyanin